MHVRVFIGKYVAKRMCTYMHFREKIEFHILLCKKSQAKKQIMGCRGKSSCGFETKKSLFWIQNFLTRINFWIEVFSWNTNTRKWCKEITQKRSPYVLFFFFVLQNHTMHDFFLFLFYNLHKQTLMRNKVKESFIQTFCAGFLFFRAEQTKLNK